MIKPPNQAIRELRKIISQTQAEFAVMIGVSKDAVGNWEAGRNQVTESFARRLVLVTGVDGRMLRMGVSVPLSTAEDEHVSTEEDYDRHRESEWGQRVDGLSIEWTRWSWCCWRRPGLAAKKSGIGCRVALSLKLETSRRQFFPVWQKIGGRLQRLPARQGRVAGVFKQKFQRRRFDMAVAKDHVGFASWIQFGTHPIMPCPLL